MKKKKLLVLGLGSLLALAACGTVPVTDVDQELPKDDPSSVVTIDFWHCLGQAKEYTLLQVANKFNTEYAGKYRVNLIKLDGDYDSLHDTVKTKLASGEIPAITMGYPDSFSEYITKNINRSKILRLDNFIKDEDFGYSQAEIEDFVPGYYAEGTGYQFEGTWSMPMYKSTEAMYYNKSFINGCNPLNAHKFDGNDDFFSKYNRVVGKDGYEDPEQFAIDLAALRSWVEEHDGYTYNVPTKWNEMITLGQQMQRDWEAEGLTDRFYPIGYDSDANLMISQMAQRGIPYTVNNEASAADPSAHFQFVNQQAKDLLTEIVGHLRAKTLVTKNSLGGSTYTNTLFQTGNICFTIGSTGGSTYNVSSNFAVGVAAVPYSGETPKYIQQGPSICFFDNENGYVHKGAWLFYKAMASSNDNAYLALQNSYDPVRISSYETEEYKEWVSHAGEGLCYDIPTLTQTLKNYYMTSPVFVGSGTARKEMGNLISYVYSSNYSIDAAFDNAYSACITAAL